VKRGESRVAALKGEFESLEKSMQKQAELLSGAALEEKQGELRKKERALRVALEDQRDAIARKNRSEVGKVVGKIDGIIKELGASGKYGVILDANPQLVLYYDKGIDISDVVVAKLDERS
jgi:Skp family chaperone for outer membrane proteins